MIITPVLPLLSEALRGASLLYLSAKSITLPLTVGDVSAVTQRAKVPKIWQQKCHFLQDGYKKNMDGMGKESSRNTVTRSLELQLYK